MGVLPGDTNTARKIIGAVDLQDDGDVSLPTSGTVQPITLDVLGENKDRPGGGFLSRRNKARQTAPAVPGTSPILAVGFCAASDRCRAESVIRCNGMDTREGLVLCLSPGHREWLFPGGNPSRNPVRRRRRPRRSLARDLR